MSPTRLPQPVPARLSATIKVPHPVWLAAVDGAIWVTTDFGITRIDPASNKVSKTIKLGDGPGDLAWISGDGESLWVSEYDINVVDRIDPATGTVTAKIPVGQQPEGIAVASSGVWVANHHDGTVNRIDPTTNAVASTIDVSAPGASGPQSVATGLGSIWVGIPKRKTVTRIDTATAAVVAEAYDPLPASPCGDIAIGPDAVWSSSCMDSPTLARIDPSTNAVVAMIGVGGEPDNGGMGAPVIVDGAPWVPVSTYIDRSSGTSRPGALVRIDPVTNTVDRVLDLGATFEPFGMVATSDSLWIVDNAPGADRVLRVPLSALGD